MDPRAIAAAGVPVLCLDTCSLLDIMRDPTRDTQKPRDHQAGVDLITAAEAGRIVCLMADQVAHEFAEHDQSIQDEASKNLEAIKERMVRINDLSVVYGFSPTLNLEHLDDYVSRSRAVVGRWITRLQRITPDQFAEKRAFARMNACRAPAKRGKESSKDCLIYETYLEAMVALRAAGVSAPIVYLSSNVNDYVEDGLLKPDLQADFSAHNLTYARNMSEAKYLLFPRVAVTL